MKKSRDISYFCLLKTSNTALQNKSPKKIYLITFVPLFCRGELPDNNRIAFNFLLFAPSCPCCVLEMRRLSVTLNSPTTQSVNAQCLSFINLFSWSFSLFHYSVMFSSLDLEMVPHLLLSSSPFLPDHPQSLAPSICPRFPLQRSTAQLVGSPRQGISPSVEEPRTRAITLNSASVSTWTEKLGLNFLPYSSPGPSLPATKG